MTGITRAMGAVLALSGAAIVALACGTDPSGVESCRKIEEARCRKAVSCPNIDMDKPPHNGDKVEGCILWYHDACLHGLEVPDPGDGPVKACVEAINGGDCNVVAQPGIHPSCAWIVPPDRRPPPDAGQDG